LRLMPDDNYSLVTKGLQGSAAGCRTPFEPTLRANRPVGNSTGSYIERSRLPGVTVNVRKGTLEKE
jgi:hypothetical protein